MLTATINRWLFPLVGLFIVGPIAAWPVAALRSPDGAWDTTPIMSDAPLLGLLAGIIALLIAGLWGVITARIVTVRYGLFTTGLALAWVAWSTGVMDLIMRNESAAARYWRLPIEALLLGALAVLIAGVIAAVGKRPHKKPDTEDDNAHAAPFLTRITRGVTDTVALFKPNSSTDFNLGRRALIVLAAAVVAALAAWLIAVDSLKGQTFAAAAIATLLGATAGEVVATSGAKTGAHTRPRRTSPDTSKDAPTGATANTLAEDFGAPVPLFFIAAVILAALAPIAAMATHSGPAGVAQAATTAHLLALSRPLPLDWLAGAFIGIPIGLTWADALIDRAAKA